MEEAAAGLRRHRPATCRVLSDLARDPERDLLRGAEGGARLRLDPRRQRGAPLSRRLDHGDEARGRLRRLDRLLHRLDRGRPHRLLRLERPQQPAGHDQVPLPRQARRHQDRRRQSVPRARARALLGAVGDGERAVRHAPRRPLVRGEHRRRPGVPQRRGEGAARLCPAASIASSSRAAPRASRRCGTTSTRSRGRSSSARAAPAAR